MSRETISPPRRVILCFYCGKPVSPPKYILRRASSTSSEHSDSIEHLFSRVFLLRCRSCVREAVYTIDQVIDSPETPPPQESSLK
jgi:hypothetical protein